MQYPQWNRLLRFSPWHFPLILPVIGFILTIPYMLPLPIYPDEQQWTLINSRMLIDGGKLIYLFPACAKGFLLATPFTWYISRFVDAILFADMTDPQRLRYWSIGIFIAIVIYTGWFASRTLQIRPTAIVGVGAVLAPMSLGVLPFLLVFHRPEQSLVLLLLIGVTLPMLLPADRPKMPMTVALTGLYIVLAWSVTAAHIKGMFLLPALLLSAYFAIRRWLPSLLITGAAGFGLFETYRLWEQRTDCPESPFLTQILGSMSLSPADLRHGVASFLQRALENFINAPAYWHSISFQREYQSGWIPPTNDALTGFEQFANWIMPILVFLGLAIVALAVIVELNDARLGHWPRRCTSIAVLIVLGLFCLAGFQRTKNFYEASLQAPMLGLAVVLALPGVLQSIPLARRLGYLLITIIAVVSFASQVDSSYRLKYALPGWRQAVVAREQQQTELRHLLDLCEIDPGSKSQRIVMDDFAYTVLWRTREPIPLFSFYGWWGTGNNRSEIARKMDVSAVVGACRTFPPEYRDSATSDGSYCCKKLGSPNAQNSR